MERWLRNLSEAIDMDLDAIFEEVKRKMAVPTPYFQCHECGADIDAANPASTLGCEYQALDTFELRLQKAQDNPKLPVFQIWYAERKKFRLFRVRLVCHKRCRHAQIRLLADARWIAKDGAWQIDRRVGVRTRRKLLNSEWPEYPGEL